MLPALPTLKPVVPVSEGGTGEKLFEIRGDPKMGLSLEIPAGALPGAPEKGASVEGPQPRLALTSHAPQRVSYLSEAEN